MTTEQVRQLTGLIDVVTAGRAIPWSRETSYRRARDGGWPIPVLRVGNSWRVRAADLQAFLGLEPAADVDQVADARRKDPTLKARQDAWVKRQLENCPPLTLEARELIKRLMRDHAPPSAECHSGGETPAAVPGPDAA